MEFNYHIPTKILFGQGKLDELGTIKLPGKKALICITGGGSMKKLGYLDRVIELFKKNHVDSVVFDQVQPNPTSKGVMAAVELGIREGVDFTVGLGGGSCIDTAKATAVVIRNGGNVWDYMGGITGKLKPVSKGALPIIVISTTSGTGSEVNPFAVITKEETFEKIDLSSDQVFPAITVVDPCLQTSVPKSLTAFQGMDVLFHSAEGYICNCATPFSDMYALQSISLVAKHLIAAVEDGNNMEAREGMCLANIYAGMVESTAGCTSEHAIGHSLSAMHPSLPHGAALSLVCVECFKYYARFIPDKLAQMAAAVGRRAEASEFIDFLEDLLRETGAGNIDIGEYGLDPTKAEEYAKNSYDVTQVLHDCDIYPMPLDECTEIISKSLIR
ncbi:MAG TPA: iron-containing alcohol dehydrogenase [Bacillota bacterium]|nr:iron-containing alcohol dehydrogenase [Bacillota bacterium]HOR85027.1 iron-containing alcohol dehydrogenase [Bacillota bacterium]HPL52951.1 iron-containing alcohol dehydrogenase [Bacillota bacterium]